MNFLDVVMPPEWETCAELLTLEETVVILAAVAVVLLLSVFFAYRYRKGCKG